MEIWRKKLIARNYISLAKAVVDRAIEDTKIKTTAGKNSTEHLTNNIKASAIYFLNNFDGSIYDGLIEPTPAEREEIHKAAKL